MLSERYGPPFETNPELPQQLLNAFMEDDPTHQGVKVLMAVQDRFRLWYVVCKMLNALPTPKVFVDIGTWEGGSALLMYSAMKRTFGDNFRGYTIDPAPQFVPFDRVYSRIQDRVAHVSMPSHEAAKRVRGEQEGLDLVFVDGGHSYECVKQDILDYYPMLRKGGVIVFHDWVLPSVKLNKPVSSGVYSACTEIMENTHYCEPMDIPLLSESWQKPPGYNIVDVPTLLRGYRKP